MLRHFIVRDMKLSAFLYDMVKSNEKMKNLHEIIPCVVKISGYL